MIALLLNAMTENYQAVRGASATLRHVTVVEEAHRLLARGSKSGGAEEAQAKEKAAEAFANTLAENRKYGEGLIIAEQIPSKLVEDAVKNTNLKIMHRLTAEEERRYLGETMGLDDAQSRFATRLSTGEALVYADEYPEATLAEIKPRLASSTPHPVASDIQPPFSFCAPCRAQVSIPGRRPRDQPRRRLARQDQRPLGGNGNAGRRSRRIEVGIRRARHRPAFSRRWISCPAVAGARAQSRCPMRVRPRHGLADDEDVGQLA